MNVPEAFTDKTINDGAVNPQKFDLAKVLPYHSQR